MVEKKYTKVYFRVFPMEKMTWDYLKILDDQKTIYIRCLQELMKVKENIVPTFWTFLSDHVFFNHSQKQIYDQIVPEVLDNVSQGHDAILMAYGQTGSGKSLTVNGVYNPFEDRGILPRLASDLFNKVKVDSAKNIKICIQASYVEFSRTSINDLLKSYPNKLYSLKDVIKIKLRSLEDTFKTIFRGEGRKICSDSNKYASHSCSSIFTFYINTKNLELQENSISKCKLHIIDLAGSDNVGNYSCLFKNSQEIGAANLAKTQLEQFFLVLCSDVPAYIKIKQRLNPMINYLGDSLNKTSILRLIGHIRVSREDLLITISMLRFGQLISGLKSTRYVVTVDEVTREKIDSLQKELDRLKLENKYNAILMNQDLTKSMNAERYGHIERTVNEYLQNKITELTLLNVCDINIALEILKMIVKKEEKNKVDNSSLTKQKRLSSSSIRSKKSKGSNKSSSDRLSKRSSGDKPRSSSATTSKDKMASLQETASKTRSKTSNSSLMKRPSTGRKASNASIRERSKSKSNEKILIPIIPPEYTDAWNVYLTERNEDYARFIKLYEKNESGAKNIYRTYLNELDKLSEVTARVDKHKNDLMMAKMTREFQMGQYNNNGTSMLSDFEKCCMKELEKAMDDRQQKRELVLKCQAELKIYVNFCKDVKTDLQNSFNEFCKEKYQTPVVNLESSEPAPMDIVETLNKEEEEIVRQTDVEDEEAKTFDRLKKLIEIEKRKKRLYVMKHREWLTY